MPLTCKLLIRHFLQVILIDHSHTLIVAVNDDRKSVRLAWGRVPLNSGSKVRLCVLLLSLGVNAVKVKLDIMRTANTWTSVSRGCTNLNLAS